MKQKKEDLLIELAKISQSHEELVSGDERKRKEFAKAFDWKKFSNYSYSTSTDYVIPSWEEIFVEVGKLLARKDVYDYENRFRGIESIVQRIQDEMDAEKETK